MAMSHKSGVYLITNLVTQKVYVGSTTGCIQNRWKSHIGDLKKQRHHNRHLQSSWNKYGSHQFTFSILRRCHSDRCISVEQYYIDKYQSYKREFGYNLSPTAGNTRGVKHGAAYRKKLSSSIKAAHARPEVIALRARVMNTSEFKIRHRAAMKKVVTSTSYRQKMSKSVTKALANPEVRKKISDGVKRAYRNNPEMLKKVAASSTGRKHSEATLAKMRAWWANPDNKERVASKTRGRSKSPETIQKMKEAARRRFQKH